MGRQDAIEIDGVIADTLPNAMFKAKLASGHEILTHVSGRTCVHYIRILLGGHVTVGISSYGLTCGHITFRHKQVVNWGGKHMEVGPSVKPICGECRITKCKDRVMATCENPRHKQRQEN